MQVSYETMKQMINESPDMAKRILPDVLRRRLIELRREQDDLRRLLEQVGEDSSQAEGILKQTITKERETLTLLFEKNVGEINPPPGNFKMPETATYKCLSCGEQGFYESEETIYHICKKPTTYEGIDV